MAPPKSVYVSKAGGEQLKNYKYNGQDLSLLYKYALSPMAQFFVDRLPMWIAPNVITLSGLSLIVVAHFLAVFSDPLMEGKQPNWQYIVSGITLFCYSTLDNMDGKQARRTGSGSPLGLLFDHGCDAMNAGILSATTFCCAISTGPTYYAYLVWASIISAFWFASWEEFHLGYFILPIVNGPNEGIMASVAIFIGTGLYGPEWTRTPLIGERTFFDIAMIMAAGPSLLTCAYQLYNVYVDAKEKNKSFKAALFRLVPLGIIQGSGLAWITLSESLMTTNYRLLFLILGVVFSDSVMKLMLAHLTHQAYKPSWACILMLILGPVNALIGLVDEESLMWVMLAIATLNLCVFVYVCSHEIMYYLDVYCFSIKHKKKASE